MTNKVNSDAQRSICDVFPTVVNNAIVSVSKPKNYHKDFTKAKTEAKKLFMKFDQSGVFHAHNWNSGEPLRMFLQHIIFFMKDYTEVKFKHDFAEEMVRLMSDLRIVKAVKAAHLNLFEVIQVMAWDKAEVKNSIQKLGIKNVNAFSDGLDWANKRDLQVYSLSELAPFFEEFGLTKDDYDQDWSQNQSTKEEAA